MSGSINLYYSGEIVYGDPIEIMLNEADPCFFKVSDLGLPWRGIVMCNIGDLGGECFSLGDEEFVIKQKIYVPGKDYSAGEIYFICPDKRKIFPFLGDKSDVLFRESDKIMKSYGFDGEPGDIVGPLLGKGFELYKGP